MKVIGGAICTDINAGGNTIGCIVSKYPISSIEFETITVRFNSSYSGKEVESQNNVLTYARNHLGYDRDIVAPVVTILSNRKTPIHVLASGMISSVIASNKTITESNRCSISITTAGAKPNSVVEWFVDIPQTTDLTRKVLFIEKFNIYLTAGDIAHLEDIRHHKTTNVAPGSEPTPLLTVHARGNIKQSKKLYYVIKGLVGFVMVEPCADSESVITVTAHTVGGEIKSDIVVSNKDMCNMESSLYHLCTEMGDSEEEMLFDYDLERLRKNYDQLKSNLVVKNKDSLSVVSALRAENEKLKTLVKSNETALSELKLKQEQEKTKQQEVKTVATSVSAESGVISDSLKVGGAVLGFSGVLIAIISKMNLGSAATASLIEWAIPVFGLSSGIVAGISGIGIGLITAAIGLVSFIGGFFF